MTEKTQFVAKQALKRITSLEGTIARMEEARHEPIAVTGVSCRFPGNVEGVDAYWEFLEKGGDGIEHDAAVRWRRITPEFDALSETTKNAARHAGFITDFDGFDAEYFGLTPRECKTMDPQQRLALELSASALQNAGYAGHDLRGSRTGIYFGVGGNEYLPLMRDAHAADEAFFITGNALNVIAGRIAYLLGLQGPSMVVDTACSSSLVGVHLAVQALRRGDCDVALSGGFNMLLDPRTFGSLDAAGMLSEDGACKTFDKDANGYVRGEGGGVIVLKTLSKAQADGDRIFGLIKGSAVNQDGRSSSLTAPNGRSQIAVIEKALADAQLSSQDVRFVETHGTGTPLGDPIEVGALNTVYGDHRRSPLTLGAVKSNIGHLESASGIAGLIKALLSLRAGHLPKNIKCTTVNPYISLEEGRLHLADGKKALERYRDTNGKDVPLYGGVSSFGFSGTNAHIIVGEAPSALSSHNNPPESGSVAMVSARSPESFKRVSGAYAEALKGSTASLSAITAGMAVERDHALYRRAFHVETHDELNDVLRKAACGEELPKRSSFPSDAPRIGFMYTGQGSQYAGMGKALYEQFTPYREAIEACARVLDTVLPKPIMSVLWGENSELINQTAYTQPALFCLQYALSRLWYAFGITPTVAIGHSVGEYAAACMAGIFSLDDALRLIAKRGALMQSLPAGGGMVVLACDRTRAYELMAGHEHHVGIAAFNSPYQTVISGDLNALEAIISQAHDIRSIRLDVSHAFHSPLMAPILSSFHDDVQSVSFGDADFNIIPNYRADGEKSLKSADYWTGHIASPVDFMGGIEAFAKEVDVVIEIGPKALLTGLVRWQSFEIDAGRWLPSLDPRIGDRECMLSTIAKLYELGIDVQWRALYSGISRTDVHLPCYPYERKRFWFDSATEAGSVRVTSPAQGGADKTHPLLGDRLLLPAGQPIIYQSALSAGSPGYLDHHRLFDVIVVPGASHVSMVIQAVSDAFNRDDCVLENIVFYEPIVIDDHDAKIAQLIITPQEGPSRYAFRIVSCTNAHRPYDEESWSTHATGEISFVSDVGDKFYEAPQTLTEEQKRRSSCETSAEFYDKMWNDGYTLGSAFRWVGDHYSSEGRVYAMTVPETPDAYDRYQIYPGLLDSCFQAFGASVSIAMDEGDIFIPFSFARIHVRHHVDTTELFTVTTSDVNMTSDACIGNFALVDGTGRVLLEVDGLELRKSSREKLRSFLHSAGHYADSYITAWVEKACSEEGKRLSGAWGLLFDRDTKEFVEPIKATLTRSGAEDVRAIEGTDEGTGALSFLEKEESGRIAGIIDLRPLSERFGVRYSSEGMLERLTQQWRQSTNVLKTVSALQSDEKPAVAFLTRHAFPVDAEVDPLQHAHARLMRVAQTEMGLSKIAIIDVPEDVAGFAQESQSLADDIMVLGTETDVALRSHGRFVKRLETSVLPHPHDRDLIQGDHRSLVLTGGLGGVGLRLVQWLASQGAKNMALLVRRDPTPSEGAALDKARAQGAKIRTVMCDLADLNSVRESLDLIEKEGPPITGVFHLAGVIDDQFLSDMTDAAFAKVLSPKALAAWNVHLSTLNRPIDVFVSYSSISGVCGTPAQGNYVVANGFLDGLAEMRRAQGLAGTALAWGPWAEVGMAARGSQNEVGNVERFGLKLIPLEVAFNTQSPWLSAETASHAPVSPLLMDVDWPSFLNNFPGAAQNTLYDTQRRASSAGSEEPSAYLEELTEVTESERKDLLIAQIGEILANVLRLEEGHQIDPDVGFFSLGIDSLMSLELRVKLERYYRVTLSPTVAFNYSTVSALAAHLLDDHLILDDEAQPPPDTDDNRYSTASDLPSDEALAEMSEDDLAALLSDELESSL